jgi:HK97 family phage portal protein
MILATRDRGEMRVGGLSRKSLGEDWPWGVAPPADWLNSGQLLTVNQAVGVPALLACLLYLSDSIAMLPSIVYRRTAAGGAERAEGTWQWGLFHDRPNPDSTPADMRADVVLSLAGGGNSYVRKWKNAGGRGRVVQLEVLDRRFVRARRGAGGRTVFDDFTRTGDPRDSLTRDAGDIIHIRLGRLNASSALEYSPEGMSPITAARMAWATALKRQQFEMSHYENDASPGVVFSFPPSINEGQAEEWSNLWDSEHAGPHNARRTGFIGGGATMQVIPVSLQDAQFVESKKLTLADTGSVYRIPRSFLNDGDVKQPTSPDMERQRLVTFGLGPYLTRMDEAFSADQDLFPNGGRDGYVEHLADALLRPDMLSRYTAYTSARQGSWITANEIRARENLPPKDGGDEIQMTPVGGAVNPGLGDTDIPNPDNTEPDGDD